MESLWFPKIEKSYKKRKLYKIPFTSQHRHQIVLTKPKLCISDCDGARTKHIGIHFKKEIKKSESGECGYMEEEYVALLLGIPSIWIP